MDEQKEKQNAKKKRSALPIYAIGIGRRDECS